MKRFLLILIAVSLLFIGCSSQSDYAEVLKEWEQQRQLGQSANLTGQMATLQTIINQKEVEIAQLNADKINQSNQIQWLQSQIQDLPTQQQITDLKSQLDTTNKALFDMTNQQAETQRRVIALAASEYELNRQLKDEKEKYQKLLNLLATSNVTLEN